MDRLLAAMDAGRDRQGRRLRPAAEEEVGRLREAAASLLPGRQLPLLLFPPDRRDRRRGVSPPSAGGAARFAPLVCGFNADGQVRRPRRRADAGQVPVLAGGRRDPLPPRRPDEHDQRGNRPRQSPGPLRHLRALRRPAASPSSSIRTAPRSASMTSTSTSTSSRKCSSAFPETTFVWAHCGISRRVFHKNYHEMVSTLLDRYPNLHVDISWVVYDDVICNMLEPKKHWLETIDRHAGPLLPGQRPLRPLRPPGPDPGPLQRPPARPLAPGPAPRRLRERRTALVRPAANRPEARPKMIASVSGTSPCSSLVSVQATLLAYLAPSEMESADPGPADPLHPGRAGRGSAGEHDPRRRP